MGYHSEGYSSYLKKNVKKKLIYFYQVFPLNPKALSLGELYGEFEFSSNNWTDGVLSSIVRNACNGRFYFYINY